MSNTLLRHIGNKLIRGSAKLQQRNLSCEILQSSQELECLPLLTRQKHGFCQIPRNWSQIRCLSQTTGNDGEKTLKGVSQKTELDQPLVDGTLKKDDKEQFGDKGAENEDKYQHLKDQEEVYLSRKQNVKSPIKGSELSIEDLKKQNKILLDELEKLKLTVSQQPQFPPKLPWKSTQAERLQKPLVFVKNTEIDHHRAMSEYLLSPKDLENIPKRKSRSSVSRLTEEILYRAVDLEKKAIEKWGSMKNLEKEKRLRQSLLDNQYLYLGLDPIRRTSLHELEHQREESQFKQFMKDTSSRVVMYAIGINLINTGLKFYLWWWSGSPSLYSEAIHSVVDTINQCCLLYGLYWSKKKPDSQHPYGFGIAKNVTALVSGICFFGAGAGSAFHRAFTDYMNPVVPGDLFMPISLMTFSLVTEGVSFIYAYRVMQKNAKMKGKSLLNHIKSGNDPNVSVVLCEDGVAVLGVFVAMAAMTATYFTGNPLFDTCGALSIASMMAGISGLLIKTNVSSLIQKSIPEDDISLIRKFLEDQQIIRSVQDIKATEMGGEVRFKAEVSFDGNVLAQMYLEKNRDKIKQELSDPKLYTEEGLDLFMANLCSSQVDLIGLTIDRIEADLKKHFKEKYKISIRHIDLEPI